MPSLRALLPRQRRALAFAAVGLTLTVGAGVTTLAAWTDHEYVWGGLGDTNAVPGGTNGGVATSQFNVQQSVDGGTTWTDQMATPGGQITFSATAAALSPGTTTYGYVQLRTVTKSVAGTLSLSPASFPYPSTDAGLASTLTYGAKTGVSAANCSAGGYAGGGTALVADGSALTSGSGSTTFRLGAGTSSAPGTSVGICFAMTLPSSATTAVAGKTATPVWHFDAISD